MKPRGRPEKARYVQNMPKVIQFSPRGRPGRPEEVNLTFDQLEAIKLSDLEFFEQKKSAELMGISRPSFSRTLSKARRIIADALINGKIIRIVGGRIIFKKE